MYETKQLYSYIIKQPTEPTLPCRLCDLCCRWLDSSMCIFKENDETWYLHSRCLARYLQ